MHSHAGTIHVRSWSQAEVRRVFTGSPATRMTQTGSRANERGRWVLLNAAGPPRWSYPTYPPSIQSELFYTELEKRLLKIRQRQFLFPL